MGADAYLASLLYPKTRFDRGFFSKQIFLQWGKNYILCKILKPCPILTLPALTATYKLWVLWSLVYPAW